MTDPLDPLDPLGQWTSPAAHRRTLELYRSLRADAWGGQVEERDVDGTFGTTHVFQWHGSESTPLVLIHGAQTSSLMWTPLIAELPGRAIYAFDTPGDPGESVQTAPITDTDGLARWLDETLDRLQLAQVHLVGSSYGGWLAVHYAAARPAKVASLSLLEPVADKVRPKFFVHGVATGIAMSIPGPQRRPLLRRLDMEKVLEDPRLKELGLLGFTKHRRKTLPKISPIPDDVLAAVAVPTLALFGARSPLHHPKQIASRFERLVPNIEVDVLPRAGHALPVEQATEVALRLGTFIDRVDEPDPTARPSNPR